MSAPNSYLILDSSLSSLAVRLQDEITELRNSLQFSSDHPIFSSPFSLQVKRKELTCGFTAFLGVRKVMVVSPATKLPSGEFQVLVKAISPDYLTTGRPMEKNKGKEKPVGILKEFIGTEEACKKAMKEFTKGKRQHQVISKSITKVEGMVDTFQVSVLLTSRGARRPRSILGTSKEVELLDT